MVKKVGPKINISYVGHSEYTLIYINIHRSKGTLNIYLREICYKSRNTQKFHEILICRRL